MKSATLVPRSAAGQTRDPQAGEWLADGRRRRRSTFENKELRYGHIGLAISRKARSWIGRARRDGTEDLS